MYALAICSLTNSLTLNITAGAVQPVQKYVGVAPFLPFGLLCRSPISGRLSPVVIITLTTKSLSAGTNWPHPWHLTRRI